jgi:hypothetical protein
MQCPRVARASGFLYILVALSLILSAGAQERTLVELEKSDEIVGGYALYEGMAGPEVTNFLLNELSDSAPVLVHLSTKDSSKPVNMKIVRQQWERTLKEGSTAEDGTIGFGLKASDHIGIVLSAPEPTRYQLLVWVGPEMEWPATPGLVAMPPEVDDDPNESVVDEEGFQPEPIPKLEKSDREIPSDKTDFAALLMVSNVLAWCCLGFLFLRTRKSNVAVLLIAASMVVSAPHVQAQPTVEPPQKKTLKESWDSTRETVDRLIELSGGSTGHGATDNALKYQKLMLHLAKYVFDYVDPKESVTKANFPPPGIPGLPSRAVNDPNDRMNKRLYEYQAIEADIAKWVGLLETQRAILLEAEFKAKSITELGDAVGGIHGLAGLAWIAAKSDSSIAASKKALYDSYDKNYLVLIKHCNEGLVKLGKMERTYYGDQDWYYLHGLPYYLYLRERYSRR